MNRLAIVLLLGFAVAARCSERQPSGSPSRTGPPDPDPQNPIAVQVRGTTSTYTVSSHQMIFEVTLTNTSPEPIAACAEDWSRQTGLVYLRVFDDSGRELRPTGGLHADFNVEEEDNLVLLRPGAHISGRVDLLVRGTTYPLKPGTYRVVAGYYCPFDGVRELHGVTAKIAGLPQVSPPVTIAVVE